MPVGHAERRNIVFHDQTGRSHDIGMKRKDTTHLKQSPASLNPVVNG
jgi:hypothetical protein